MFRLNFWAQSVMSPSGPSGLPFSGAVDPRYACLSSVTPTLPPPPMSMLYTSPPSGLLLPESFYRRPVVGLSEDSEKLSPELSDSLAAEAGRVSTTSPRMLGRHQRQLDSSTEPLTSALCAAATGRTHQLSYPSLLLHTQLEALRHYQQQQQQQHEQVHEDTAADSESDARCSTATESSTSAFRQPRRRHRVTPDHITPDSDRTPPPLPHNTDDRSPARKTGKLFHANFNITFRREQAYA